MSSQLIWSILKQFASRNSLCFTFQDVVKEFPEKNRVYLSRILADMVRKGMLCKITRDNYHIIPFNADAETYYPDAHQVAKCIMQNKEYYIGYASALKLHGLKSLSEVKESDPNQSQLQQADPNQSQLQQVDPNQSQLQQADPNQSQFQKAHPKETHPIEYVVTRKQTRLSIRSFGGITCQFIQHDENRFFGFDSIWINEHEKAMFSDLEKTLVDIATKPRLVGGIVEVGNAFFQAKARTDHTKLFLYFARNRNKSAKKRFLFLTDLLGMEWTNEHKRMMEELGTGISLLDPSAPDQGRKRRKFGLKINVDPLHIKEMVLQPKIL